MDYLRSNKLISQHQHGFIKRKSTLTNLIDCFNDWTIALSNNEEVSAVYIDFTRAFDLVPHDKLLLKLSAYGIEGNLAKWIEKFLTAWMQCTKVNQSFSEYKPVTSGVIQGNCLGPLLFLIYINDILDCTTPSTQMKLYTDDVKLYSYSHTQSDNHHIQTVLDNISDWSTKWELPISSTKCASLHIGCTVQSNTDLVLSNCTVPVVDHIKHLGITVNTQFRFDAHISDVVRIGHHRSQLILRCFKSKNSQLLLMAYETYVRPVLEYNSSLWSPTLIKDIVAIEKIQRRFTKGLSNLRNNVSPAIVRLKTGKP